MRTTYTNYLRSLAAFALAAMTALLTGCGAGGTPAATTTTTGPTTARIAITSSAQSIKSDGSNPATLTAVALSSGNAVLAGDTLTAAASAGQVSPAAVVTDASGQAIFTFVAGATRNNETATITVTASSGATASIPIQITGSTLTLTSSAASMSTGVPVTITAVAKDAGSNVVSGQTLRYSIAATSAGSATLSTGSGTTDISGVASFKVTGTANGNVDVLVEWLNAAGAVTTKQTTTITFSSSAGSFSLTTPASSPFPVTVGSTSTVAVSITGTIAQLRYSSTLGTWDGTGLASITVPPATATSDIRVFHPGGNAGNASVQIDALDGAGAVLSTANFIFSITANTANSISLQSNVAVIPPSSGTTSSTATFTAKVIDAIGNPVGGAPVQFTLVNSTGTGETLSPVVATTNSTTGPLGEAQTTFTAGTSTTQNAAVKATVIGTTLFAQKTIVVGGTVGSIAIGVSNKQASIASDTAYQLPVTVLVSDSNGNAVSGATVSLSLWPTIYYYGYRDASCALVLTGLLHSGAATPYFHLNEDANRNFVIDPGEDTDSPGNLGADGLLTPPLADAGTIPSTVTTGADGTATFNYVFLKKYANWLNVRLTASTTALGNPTAYTDIYLLPLANDVSGTTCLGNSPYN